MKIPMTTNQARARFDPKGTGKDIEGETCSLRCSDCRERVWFQGSHSDRDTPEKFECPYCEQTVKNIYAVRD